MIEKRSDSDKRPPFEVEDLRKNLAAFLSQKIDDPSGARVELGSYKWGVYAFYDYDGEPIYVGQTRESLSARIGRHLTNQRTDAVAMSVLDPFEVLEIKVWPLPQFQNAKSDTATKSHLNALERMITQQAVAESEFKAILNEKNPPSGTDIVEIPASYRGRIVSDRVFELRSHTDLRIARRALTISRLAQVISERQVKGGLRRVLVTQSKRLQWLAERRFTALGGQATVEAKTGSDEEEDAGD